MSAKASVSGKVTDQTTIASADTDDSQQSGRVIDRAKVTALNTGMTLDEVQAILADSEPSE